MSESKNISGWVGRRCPHRAADDVTHSRWAEDGHALAGALTSAAVVVLFFGIAINSARAAVVFDVYSAYHYIEVTDNNGVRMLSFNGSMETRMSTAQPLQGHFEYTEFFHMPWLWNTNVKRVLMIGLGGGSTQRSYQHYYTNVHVDTVELDPVVVRVAKDFFHVTESPTHKIHLQDGRVFLRRTTNLWDVILMDAYATTRYGSSVPPHLTTKEFFTQVRNHLPTNGVLAYNLIGEIEGWNQDFVGGLYRTIKEVFPQVYLFKATETRNVVLIATRSNERFDITRVQKDGAALIRNGKILVPTFTARLQSFVNFPPSSAARVPVFTDDRAGVEGLLR
jgi:spermidine synthase